MLGKSERKICQHTIDEGRVISQESCKCEGICVTYFCVEYKGWLYDITMHDGAYVYFHRAGLASGEEIWEN